MSSNKRKAGVPTCAGSKRIRGVARQQPSPSQSVEPQSDGIQSDGLQPISQPDGSLPVVACTPKPPQPAQSVLPDNQQAGPVQYQSLVRATKPLQLPDLGASFMQGESNRLPIATYFHLCKVSPTCYQLRHTMNMTSLYLM